MDDKKNSFIDFLDSHQLKRQCSYNDYITLLNTINFHFQDNNLSHNDFTGRNSYIEIDRRSSTIHNNSQNYYSLYSKNIGNQSEKETNLYNNSKYSLWQRKHEFDISLNTKVEKQYVHIDSNIQNLKDLITIINDNEYLENTEYNIDLKSLHNIKKELIELDSMIGMESMKKSVLFQLLYFVQELHVGKNTSDFKHTVIYGPPGTGKTEIAKIIGQMYSKMGILKNNVFKKVTRNDLVAGYLGQTALKTRKVIDECIGGVLFIDEAYSLANSENNDSYSKECIDILCEALSAHKDELMVIIAGYEEELEETFFKANRGLESRFIWRFKIDSYNSQEMMKIFKKKVKDNEWEFENVDELKEVWFEKKKDDFKNFGRDMELLFSYVKVVHGRRIYGKDKSLRKKITLEDLNSGYDIMLKNKKNKKQTQDFMHSIFI